VTKAVFGKTRVIVTKAVQHRSMMIISNVDGLWEVKRAMLKSPQGMPLRYYSSSEEIRSFLIKHPNKMFLLEAKIIGDDLAPTSPSHYGPEFGDIFCGQIRYNSRSNGFECS